VKTLKFLLVLGLILGVTSAAIAAEKGRIASITEIEGKVQVKLAGERWKAAEVGMVLKQKDAIRTRRNSTAVLNVNGNAQTAIVQMKENSHLSLAKLIEDAKKGSQKTLLDLSLGSILIKAQKLHSKKSSFEVKTPTSIVGVRGTTFSVIVEAIE